MRLLQNRAAKYGLAVGAIIVIILAFGYLFYKSIVDSGGGEQFPLSGFIIVAAILGSAVNQPFRHAELQHATYGWIVGYLFWKSTVSIVFAFFLYMMFISGLVSGDMFPRFVKTTVETGGQYGNMEGFATSVDPESYKDAAKILVWSFVAGYSEKFVPNLISQMLKTSENGNNNNGV